MAKREETFGVRLTARDESSPVFRSFLGNVDAAGKRAAGLITAPLRMAAAATRSLFSGNLFFGLQNLKMGLQGLQRIADQLERGTRFNNLVRGLRDIGRLDGDNSALLLARRLQAAAGHNLSLFAALQSTNRALQSSKLTATQLQVIYQYAARSADALDRSTGDVVDTLTRGLVRGRTGMLADVGILVDGIEGVKADYEALRGAGSWDALRPAAQDAQVISRAIAEMRRQVDVLGAAGQQGQATTFSRIKTNLRDIADQALGAMAGGAGSGPIARALQTVETVTRGMARMRPQELVGQVEGLGQALWASVKVGAGEAAGFLADAFSGPMGHAITQALQHPVDTLLTGVGKAGDILAGALGSAWDNLTPRITAVMEAGFVTVDDLVTRSVSKLEQGAYRIITRFKTELEALGIVGALAALKTIGEHYFGGKAVQGLAQGAAGGGGGGSVIVAPGGARAGVGMAGRLARWAGYGVGAIASPAVVPALGGMAIAAGTIGLGALLGFGLGAPSAAENERIAQGQRDQAWATREMARRREAARNAGWRHFTGTLPYTTPAAAPASQPAAPGKSLGEVFKEALDKRLAAVPPAMRTVTTAVTDAMNQVRESAKQNAPTITRALQDVFKPVRDWWAGASGTITAAASQGAGGDVRAPFSGIPARYSQHQVTKMKTQLRQDAEMARALRRRADGSQALPGQYEQDARSMAEQEVQRRLAAGQQVPDDMRRAILREARQFTAARGLESMHQDIAARGRAIDATRTRPGSSTEEQKAIQGMNGFYGELSGVAAAVQRLLGGLRESINAVADQFGTAAHAI